MLVIKNYIEKSEINGLGLFAGQDIKEGDIVWFLDPVTDSIFTKEEFEKLLNSMDEDNKEKFEKWSYIRKDTTVVLCADNAKFMNHSNNPNIKCNGQYDVALGDIKVGEEIMCNYNEFHIELNNKEK